MTISSTSADNVQAPPPQVQATDSKVAPAQAAQSEQKAVQAVQAPIPPSSSE